MNDIPRPEHPRPDFERSAWQNLNGEWQFDIDDSRSGLEKGWSTGVEFPQRIIVPFCPESRLSGVAHTDFGRHHRRAQGRQERTGRLRRR